MGSAAGDVNFCGIVLEQEDQHDVFHQGMISERHVYVIAYNDFTRSSDLFSV